MKMLNKIFIYLLLFLYAMLNNLVYSKEYHFSSIEYLVEQEIGRLIIPQIYNKLNIKVTITPYPGKRAQMEVMAGNKDGEIMRIWTYGDENLKTIRVPTPYYYLETMPFVKKQSGIQIDNKEDLSKYRLVKIRGVKHTNNITEGLDNVVSINTTEQMMNFLEAGRADVALTNTIDGLIALKKMNNLNIVQMQKPLAVLPLYHYIHIDHQDLVPQIDGVIQQMKLSGELDEIIKKAEAKVIGD